MEAIYTKLVDLLKQHNIQCILSEDDPDQYFIELQKNGHHYCLSLDSESALLLESVWRFDIGQDWNEIFEIEKYDLNDLTLKISTFFDEKENEYLNSLKYESFEK